MNFDNKLPFSVSDVIKRLKEYVDDLNQNIEKLDCRGPVSKYVLPEEDLRGRYVFVFPLNKTAAI